MASQRTFSQRVTMVAAMLLVCAGLGMLSHVAAGAAWHALGLLPSFASIVWQAFEGFDPHWSSFCPVHVLVVSWPLLRLVVGAA